MNKIKVIISDSYHDIQINIDEFIKKNPAIEILSVNGHIQQTTKFITYILYKDNAEHKMLHESLHKEYRTTSPHTGKN